MEEKLQTFPPEDVSATNVMAAKPRKQLVAFLLSLLTPGLGQIYNGQILKAILFLGLIFIPLLFASATRLAYSFTGLVLILAVELLLRLYILVDSVISARRHNDFVPRAYNKWYYYLLFAIGIVALFEIFPAHKLLRINSFSIPTESNMPVLMAGDKVVGSLSKDEKRKPQYGELVTFNSPRGGVWVFRVVGLPGDKINVGGNFLTINDKKCKTRLVGPKVVNNVPMLEYTEELPNGKNHSILTFDADELTQRAAKQIVLPQNYYYLMGDNRDNAFDSRFIGPVSEENITGRLLYSFWGEGPGRVNIDITRQ